MAGFTTHTHNSNKTKYSISMQEHKLQKKGRTTFNLTKKDKYLITREEKQTKMKWGKGLGRGREKERGKGSQGRRKVGQRRKREARGRYVRQIREGTIFAEERKPQEREGMDFRKGA